VSFFINLKDEPPAWVLYPEETWDWRFLNLVYDKDKQCRTSSLLLLCFLYLAQRARWQPRMRLRAATDNTASADAPRRRVTTSEARIAASTRLNVLLCRLLCSVPKQ